MTGEYTEQEKAAIATMREVGVDPTEVVERATRDYERETTDGGGSAAGGGKDNKPGPVNANEIVQQAVGVVRAEQRVEKLHGEIKLTIEETLKAELPNLSARKLSMLRNEVAIKVKGGGAQKKSAEEFQKALVDTAKAVAKDEATEMGTKPRAAAAVDSRVSAAADVGQNPAGARTVVAEPSGMDAGTEEFTPGLSPDVRYPSAAELKMDAAKEANAFIKKSKAEGSWNS